MPSPGHKKRTIRAPDDLWDAFVAACPPAERGRQGGAAKVLHDFMAWYSRYDPKVKMPRRPQPGRPGRQGSGGPDVPPDTR